MNSDQDQHSVGPDLGPNCLHKLSVDDISKVVARKERVKLVDHKKQGSRRELLLFHSV